MGIIKPGLPILNRAHPLADGLIAAYMLYEGGGVVAHNIAGTIDGSIGSGISWENKPGGIACKCNGTSSGRVYIASDFDLNDDPMTLVSRIHLRTTSQHGAVIGMGNANAGFKLGVGNNTVENNGNHLILLVDQEAWVDTNRAIGTGDHQISVSWARGGSSYRLGIDGDIVKTGSKAYRTLNDRTYLGSGAYSNRYFTDSIYYTLIYNRVLENEERRSLWTDPYAMFLPHISIIVGLTASPSLVAEPASIHVTGHDADLTVSAVLTADPGSIQVTGHDVGLTAEILISLTWTDNAEHETGFTIERQTDGGAWVEVVSGLAADTESYNELVEAGHTYNYRVKAENATLGDSEWSNEDDVTV